MLVYLRECLCEKEREIWCERNKSKMFAFAAHFPQKSLSYLAGTKRNLFTYFFCLMCYLDM